MQNNGRPITQFEKKQKWTNRIRTSFNFILGAYFNASFPQIKTLIFLPSPLFTTNFNTCFCGDDSALTPSIRST